MVGPAFVRKEPWHHVSQPGLAESRIVPPRGPRGGPRRPEIAPTVVSPAARAGPGPRPGTGPRERESARINRNQCDLNPPPTNVTATAGSRTVPRVPLVGARPGPGEHGKLKIGDRIAGISPGDVPGARGAGWRVARALRCLDPRRSYEFRLPMRFLPREASSAIIKTRVCYLKNAHLSSVGLRGAWARRGRFVRNQSILRVFA